MKIVKDFTEIEGVSVARGFRTMRTPEPSIPWPTTGSGAKTIFRRGLSMAAFEFGQAQEVHAAFSAAERQLLIFSSIMN